MTPTHDEAHRVTDVYLADLEARLRDEYRKASKEAKAKLDDYLRRFRAKDEVWRKRVAAGEVTAADYKQWRFGQMMAKRRWEELKDTLAHDLRNVEKIAHAITHGYTPEIYALNYNWATYQAEHESRVDTSFALYNREAVEYIIRDNPDLLPPPGKRMTAAIAEGNALQWGRQQVQSCFAQSILLGDSIPQMAERISETLKTRSLGDAVRYARTAATGAENRGRDDAYSRAEKKKIPLTRIWIATLDNRTRHTHRRLHGETRNGERYSNGLRYPGDPSGAPSEVWNCRCCQSATVLGNVDVPKTSPKLGEMSFEEWLEAKPVYNPQTLPVEKANAIKAAHIANYRKARARLK